MQFQLRLAQLKPKIRTQCAAFAAAFLMLLMSPFAFASTGPSCAFLFSYASPQRSDLPRLAHPMHEIRRLVARLKAPRFDADAFESALADYRANGQEALVQPKAPKTSEERLAFYKYMLDQSGRHPYDLELWARSVHSKDMSTLAKSLGRLNLDDGFSPSHVYAVIARINRFVAADPRTISGLRQFGFAAINRTLLEQWVDTEITSHNMVDAFERLGLIKDQRLRQKFVDLLNSNPNFVGSIAASSIAVLQFVLAGAPMTFPVVYSKLAVTRLDPRLRRLIETKGFDAAYPVLKAKYGKAAGFDQGFFWARRTFATAANIYVLSNFYHFLLVQTLPSNLWQEQDGTLKLLNASYAYYSRYLYGLIHQDWSAANDPTQAPVTPAAVVAAPDVDDTQKISADRPALTPAAKPKSNDTRKNKLADADEKPLRDTLDSWSSLNFDDPTHR